MPLGLFGNKFSPKKTPPRRAQSLSNLHLDATESKAEFGLDYGAVKVSLGGNEVAFENGLWINESAGGGASHKELLKLRKANQSLHEENNLLKLKIDILLDMLAETSAVSHFHENEVKQLREAKQASKKR
ncbi:protein chibby 1 [Biomphalaria glabrata]|uniref:Protein chibby homolog 1-like n=1 Tax=Biomphalaria glabrata TaxID=6526 RepID=A0A2C9JFT8_BIOGL|nr:protein chibby homolog 1-like [Biomphalaria glabrata]XP_013065274.1 protein chibby homolog 1-like [Biomphalaria glabrata]XP_055877316.1 protein chibby homolog 1-like [Biomphalaria glabrata]XP_055877317.1 protein chibby homolog 1-like [Biomphalaria glabrata]KAI8764972.1 protein chibby-like protein 1-like [Biomphalaria glabrata]KAI8796901.1 protein chibby 1 [Biomphalaria glabrata]